MSEQTSTAVAGEQDDQGQAQVKEFEAITSQEDFDARIQARIDRERKKFADYDEKAAAAAELAALKEANKTEAEKVAARLEAAEKRAAELEVKAARAEVAAAKGVPVELLSGSTTEELEAAADALIAFRGEQKQTPKSEALARVNSSKVTGGPAAAFADALEGFI